MNEKQGQKLRDVDVIIKFGGSAITDKEQLETLNPQALQMSAKLIKECLENQLTSVVIHGAGSFGHHHAKQYKVNEGWRHLGSKEAIDHVKKGFCLTRQSVTKLHHHVLEALLAEGIPAVGLSLYNTWTTDKGQLKQFDLCMVDRLLEKGFIPVLHGDCIFDLTRGCGILSGDTIIKTMCKESVVQRVVFLTNVQGVYSKPPGNNADAKLRTALHVKDGCIVQQSDRSETKVVSDCRDKDVTGGMTLKLQTAVDIVTHSGGRTCVYVCKTGSDYAAQACLHGVTDSSSKEGTVIRALSMT